MAKLNFSHLTEALERARATYRNGVVASPIEGTVGPRVVQPGAVLSHGEVMAEVYHGAKYVLAYLPTNRMYGIEPGQKVIVTDGVNRESGRVERIEAITDRTAPEFQSNLQGVDRNQVARIVFDEPTRFPLLSKIRITGPMACRVFSTVLAERWHGAAKPQPRPPTRRDPRRHDPPRQSWPPPPRPFARRGSLHNRRHAA